MREVAVVTGASSAIGAAICVALADRGFEIVAHFHSGRCRAEELQATVEDRGGVCYTVHADLSRLEGVMSLVGYVRELLNSDTPGNLRVLVNNAGRILGPAFQDTSWNDFDEYIAVNLRAPFFLSQKLAAIMSSGASIVNVSSASAHIASAGDTVYAVSKAGLESLTTNAAISLATRGIRVNAVVPGFTDNGNPVFADGQALAYMGSLSVLGGVARPVHVADAVAFLVSESAARVTGAMLDVSGGTMLHPRPHSADSVRALH